MTINWECILAHLLQKEQFRHFVILLQFFFLLLLLYFFIIIISSSSSSSSISSSCCCCCCCCCCVLIIRFSLKYWYSYTLCKLKNFRLTSPYYPNPNSRKNRSQSIRINPILAHLQFPVAAAATPVLSVPVIIASAITNDQRHADLARREREICSLVVWGADRIYAAERGQFMERRGSAA